MPLPHGVYRADHVGSFLRPKEVLEARTKAANNEISAAELRKIEDEAVADVASDVGADLGDSTQNVMQDYLAIRPVIHVDQGTRITVMVDRDLEIF